MLLHATALDRSLMPALNWRRPPFRHFMFVSDDQLYPAQCRDRPERAGMKVLQNILVLRLGLDHRRCPESTGLHARRQVVDGGQPPLLGSATLTIRARTLGTLMYRLALQPDP